MAISISKIRAVQVPRAKAAFELIEREPPEPGPNQVRIKVEACGICHSDSMAKEGGFPGMRYPIVPGHEIAGVIEALGPGVLDWEVGQRVGVGWFGGNCGRCKPCRRGDLISCIRPQIPGFTFDGGYADAMVTSAVSLARIPAELAAVDAAPLLCAGITTYNALRKSGAYPGDLVAILGIGGLGHLGIQFAARMGFKTVAIARGADKKDLARTLGAHHYIDNQSEDVAGSLMKLGGAKVILSTATEVKAVSDVIKGLDIRGKLVIVGVPHEPLEVSIPGLIMGSRSIHGFASGTSIESEDTMNFSVLAGVRPMIEKFPLEQAAQAYERMMSAKALFRVVLTTGK